MWRWTTIRKAYWSCLFLQTSKSKYTSCFIFSLCVRLKCLIHFLKNPVLYNLRGSHWEQAKCKQWHSLYLLTFKSLVDYKSVANKTIIQVGSWLENEKLSIEGRQGFSLTYCLAGCVMCERPGGSLAGLLWIMAQGQAALIHWHGKLTRPESKPLTVTLPSSFSSVVCKIS